METDLRMGLGRNRGAGDFCGNGTIAPPPPPPSPSLSSGPGLLSMRVLLDARTLQARMCVHE